MKLVSRTLCKVMKLLSQTHVLVGDIKTVWSHVLVIILQTHEERSRSCSIGIGREVTDL